MPNYKKMYFQLAARVADAAEILILAQREGEEGYLEGRLPEVRLVEREEPGD